MTWSCRPLAGLGFACTDAGSCWECGGYARPGARFCTEACRESYEDNMAAMATRLEARRAEEAAWGEAAHALVEQGWGYRAVDRIMAATWTYNWTWTP